MIIKGGKGEKGKYFKSPTRLVVVGLVSHGPTFYQFSLENHLIQNLLPSNLSLTTNGKTKWKEK